ncbi:MAG: esterase [Pseudomonadota bacterium]
MRHLISALTGILLLTSWGASGNAAELRHNGMDRSYILQRPADATGPRPTLIVLHGGGGGAERIRDYTRFDMRSEGWVQVFPQGLHKRWNDGRREPPGRYLESDDVGFLSALIDDLAARGISDADRIFVVGLSNGGAMTQRLICDAPGKIAGAVVSIMNLPENLARRPSCADTAATPLMFMLGTNDPLVPYSGGSITVRNRSRGEVLSASDTMAFWAERNRCDGFASKDLTDRDPDDDTTVTVNTWAGCAAPLVEYKVNGAGHTWPGRTLPRILRRVLGKVSMEFSATAVVSEFFRDLANAR